MLGSLFTGSPRNKQKVMALVDAGAKCTLIHGRLLVPSAPLVVTEGILDTSCSSDTWFTDVFSQSLACLFNLLRVSLEAQTFLTLIKSNLLICYLGDCVFVSC